MTSNHVGANRVPRVLMLVPYPTIQGPLPKHVPLLVDGLRALGCDIETEYWSRHSDHESLLEKAVGRAGDLRRIYARLRRRRFDVMYITTAHNWAGLMRDIPLVLLTRGVCPHRVIKFHGSFSGQLSASGHAMLKSASRVLVGACDATLVLSRQEKDEWSAFYPAGRFEVVANAFSPVLAGAAAATSVGEDGGGATPSRTRSPSGVPTLVFVGRLVSEKGILDLVQAVARVNATTPCRLLVAGDGPSASRVVQTADELGIAGTVELLGYVSGPELARCYREADAFVLPTYYAEGFPTVLLEAMSAGLPIVTTRLRGAADRLEEGVNALFVPPQRPDLLAQALVRILGDDRLRAAMAANNLAKVKEFAPEVVAPQYLAILKSVIGEPIAGRGPEHRRRGSAVTLEAPPATAAARRRHDRQRLLDDALAAALAHTTWLRAYGPTSWDQYDFWANPIGRRAKAAYYRHKWLGLPLVVPFVLLDNAVPGSRRLFWHRQRFAIADAHYAMGFFALAEAHNSGWRRHGEAFIEALEDERCADEAEYCWGYQFAWETCFGTWKAGTPLITSTPYAYEAFEAAHEATGNPHHLAVMESIARFAQTRIGTASVAPGIKASAYSPQDERRVVNASAYRGFLLAAAGSRFDRPDWLAEARATLAFVVWSQQPDGSWLYAMDGKDAFVDNFHTCFVLKNLFKACRVLGDEELRAAVDKGYGFYKSHLLDDRGLPLPFARTQRLTLQRRELYDLAEGINLGLLLADVDRDASAIAMHLLANLLERWVLADGHFVTRETVFGRNTIPYHRWAQAQTFRALSCAVLRGAD